MWQTALNTVLVAAVAALAAVLGKVIVTFGDVGIKILAEKLAAAKVKVGADKWNHWMNLAHSAWDIVDEEFRITPMLEKTFAAKQAEFTAQIKKMIPEITDAEIEQLRQAVAGEVNKGKDAIEGQTQDEQGNGLGVAPAPVADVPSVAAPITSPVAPVPVAAPVAPAVTVVPAPQIPNA